MKIRIAPYATLLHVALVALSLLVVVLAQENRRLRQPPAPDVPVPGLEIGQSVEPVRLQHLDGGEETLDFTGGGKDRLLLVFTTDCSACGDNQTAWRILDERVGDSMDVVGISLSELEETRSYHEAYDLPFPVALPVDRDRLAETLAISAVPVTIRIGADGRVRGSWLGTLSEAQVTEVWTAEQG